MENILGRQKPLRDARKTGKLPWFPEEGLDKGLYEYAAEKGLTLSMLFEEWKSENLGEETPYYGKNRKEVEEIKAGFRAKGELPPAEAFDDLLFHAGIKAFGSNTDAVAKFFEYSDTDVIMPEYVSNRVYAGLLLDALYPKLTLGQTVISGTEYRKIYISDSQAERQTGIVGKGAEFHTTRISVSDKTVYLRKYGRSLEVAYEDVQYARLNTFGKALERIGQQLQIDLTDDCILTLVNGDGNTSTTPGTTVQTAASGTIAAVDVIGWANGLPSPYKMSDFVGRKALVNEYLTTLIGLNNPFDNYRIGVTLPTVHEWDRSSAIANSDYFVGIDKRYAIEHITTGAVFTETDKIINKQLNQTVISHRSAFTIFDNNAVAIFDETH